MSIYFGVEEVTKQKNCGFCGGLMLRGDMQFSEQGKKKLLWCLSCALIKLARIRGVLDEIERMVRDEMKKNADKYVRTAVTAKGRA